MNIVGYVLIFQSVLIVVLLYWINTLLNKCMSGSFYEYQVSRSVAKRSKQDNIEKVDVKIDEDAEDLAYI